jgi:hypothetical protein
MLIAQCGDTLFENLTVGSEESSHCVLSALSLVLGLDDPALVQAAISNLTFSPFVSVLVASGRRYCPDFFDTIEQLFAKPDPSFGTSDPLPARSHLTHAIRGIQVSADPFDTPLAFFAFAALRSSHVGIEDGFRRFCSSPTFVRQLFKWFIHEYSSDPDLVAGFLMTAFLPQLFQSWDSEFPSRKPTPATNFLTPRPSPASSGPKLTTIGTSLSN